jgi:fatty-acyl-CoA synthase
MIPKTQKVDESMQLDWLKKWSHFSPNNVAIKDGDSGRELNYKSFFRFANRGAQILRDQFKVIKGDRIAVLANNEIEYIILLFAAQRLGAILVPINYRLTSREVEHILSDCQPKLVVYQNEYKNQFMDSPSAKQSLALMGPESFQSKIQSGDKEVELVPFVGQDDDPAMIIYTSGTTGAPKGAIITHKMIFWNSINTTLRLNIAQTDCAVIFLPLFHTGGWNVLTTPFFHRGAKIILLKKFDGDQILKLSDSENSTLLFGVPTTMDMMARSESFSQVGLKHLRYAIVGGEPMPIRLIETWDQKGVKIRQGYGLTEFGPNVFSLNEEDSIRKIGSIGFPNFYTEAKIVDADGKELGPNQIGELLLKGPMCMAGYWQNPKATAETIVDGWLKTGDLVRRDDEGYYYVAGRKKDMYKSGGENVYPAELEQIISRLPGIQEVAVIGVPDDRWGEVGKAFIVKKSDLTELEIQNHCSQNLAKFKIPKFFKFVESLPKGDSGKILKRNLN